MLDQQTAVLTRPSTGSPLGAAGTESKDVQSHFERGRVYLSERALADGAPPFFDSAFSDDDPRDSSMFEGGSMVMSTQASHTREATRHEVGKGKGSSMPHVYASLEATVTAHLSPARGSPTGAPDDRCAVTVASPWPSAPAMPGAMPPSYRLHSHTRLGAFVAAAPTTSLEPAWWLRSAA